MDLSASQRYALSYAHAVLTNAGLSAADLDIGGYPSPPFSPTTSLSSTSSPQRRFSPFPFDVPQEASNAVQGSRYIPPPARLYTPDEVTEGRNRINRLLTADAVVEHPAGAIVEYPQTGASDNERIAHVFAIDMEPDTYFDSPQSSFQYSLGNAHGGRKGVNCHLLRDSDTGTPARCDHLHTSCKFRCLTLQLLVTH